MTDFTTFINGAASILIGELPSQSLDTAISYVYTYISNVGGWIPVNPLVPFGDGAPANGFTQQQVADAITTQQINGVYDIDFTVTTSIKVQFVAKLTAGLTLGSAAASMANQVNDFITNTINESALPVQVLSTSTQTTVSNRSLTGGYTTQAIRQAITTDLAALPGTKDVDHKGLALLYVRNTYGVDTTWNAYAVYTETNLPITVLIRKYTDTTYATLDGGTLRVYVMNISPETYQVVTGVIIG